MDAPAQTDTMGERLQYALWKREMEPKDLIAATKLSRATIYFILDDTTTPEKVWGSTVQKICKALKIRPEWLLRKDGRMEVEPPKAQKDVRGEVAPEIAELRAIMAVVAQALADSKRAAGVAMIDALKDLEDKMPQQQFVTSLKNTLEAEIGSQASVQSPKPKAPKSRAGKP